MKVSLTPNTMSIVMEEKRHSVCHDERIVVNELQAHGRETQKETISFYLVKERVVKWILISPFFKLSM